MLSCCKSNLISVKRKKCCIFLLNLKYFFYNKKFNRKIILMLVLWLIYVRFIIIDFNPSYALVHFLKICKIFLCTNWYILIYLNSNIYSPKAVKSDEENNVLLKYLNILISKQSSMMNLKYFYIKATEFDEEYKFKTIFTSELPSLM